MSRKKKNNFVMKIYRDKSVDRVNTLIDMLGTDFKMDAYTFISMQVVTTIVLFIILLYIFKIGYVIAPFISIIYYYLFNYCLLLIPVKRRGRKLEHEALYFFEILTLTMESGKNLENSLEVTVLNVDSELSNEFKRTLIEVKFGKSLIEALNDMKKRIPSETINNIILNITQSSLFGNSILDTMNNQIEFLRDKQILEIKGMISKIPNKISIISVVFIVPLILLMILGPVLINFLG